MPIIGLSEQKRLPRLGKIHLGVKKVSAKGHEYPSATNYFVCSPEVQAIYGENPKQLDVIIPVEDEEVWANQYYRQYSRSRGLVCKGDGATCRRMIDTKTGAIAGKDTTTVDWRYGLECQGRECMDYKGKACQEVMNLQFLLPKVEGLGIWQIDTGSIHSIMNINNCAEMIRAMCGRVAWIPLTLSLESTEVVNPEDGKKKSVHCMTLRYKGSAESLLIDSEKPRLQVLLAAPCDNEAPDDRLLSTHTPEKVEEIDGKVQDDIDELFPDNGKVIEAEPDKQPAAVNPAATPPTSKSPRDPATIKTQSDMVHACFADFKLQPTDVLKELNVKSLQDLTITAADAYKQIASVRT